MKSKITPGCDDINNIGDNINDIPFFFIELIRGDNSDSDDWNDNVENNELYIEEDYFEEILVEKNRKK